MALFQTVKRITEYVEPVQLQRRNKARRQQVVIIQQVVEEAILHLLHYKQQLFS